MARDKRVIVGLGNPGEEYEGTRHNVGFAVIDELARRTGTSLKHTKGNLLFGWARMRNCTFGLAKPLTYMNRSGQAVRALVNRLNLSPQDILIVLDDVHLPPGVIRIRERGSAGGHNGLQDIIDALGTDHIPRLRIGIGENFPKGKQAEYVLSPFEEHEKPVIEEAIQRAADAAVVFACEGLLPAMNRFNRRITPKKQTITKQRSQTNE